MEMYKKASRICLRFQTDRGMLSVEQLWSLTTGEISKLIKSLKQQIKKDELDDELSFLEDNNTPASDELYLRFDILKDIYMTKKSEIEYQRDKKDVDKHNEKIMALISEKEDENLREMSVDDLKKLIIKK